MVRTSSSQTTSATSPMALTRSSSLACSMKRRAVSTLRTPAVWIAAFTLRSPAVKLSMVGTRPWACRPKKVTTTPMDEGSRMPTRSAGSVMAAILRPSTKAARIRPV